MHHLTMESYYIETAAAASSTFNDLLIIPQPSTAAAAALKYFGAWEVEELKMNIRSFALHGMRCCVE